MSGANGGTNGHALREAEERHRQLFERIPIGVYRIDAHGRFLEANPALLAMIGCPDTLALESLDVKGLYADPAEFGRWRTRLESEGLLRRFERRLRRVDGTMLWVEENARLVRGESGETRHVEGSLEDITERRLAAEALRTTTEQLRSISDAFLAFLEGGDAAAACDCLLRAALTQTDSPAGFVAMATGAGLLVLTEQSVPWTELTSATAYQAALRGRAESGRFELTAPGSLLAEAIASGRAVIANPPLPGGRLATSAFQSFLGIPLRRGSELVGLLGLANRTQGYSAAEQERVEVLAQAAAVLLDGLRREEGRP